MLKFSEILNFLAKIPEFWTNSDQSPIWKVRMVRSLSDRTFQLCSGGPSRFSVERASAEGDDPWSALAVTADCTVLHDFPNMRRSYITSYNFIVFPTHQQWRTCSICLAATVFFFCQLQWTLSLDIAVTNTTEVARSASPAYRPQICTRLHRPNLRNSANICQTYYMYYIM